MNTNKGYTLMELLVTLLILSVLTVMAVATFEVPSIKAERARAKLDLLNLADSLEHYYVNFKTYRGATIEKLHYQATTTRYLVIIKQAEDNSYQIEAIPKSYSRTDECQILSLDQDGNPSISGLGTIQECW